MGGGGYSFSARSTRASTKNLAGVSYENVTLDSAHEMFEQNKKRQTHDLMDPKSVVVRESRDSEEHPNSLPIIINLDVTGSMRDVPLQLLKDGLPTIVGNVIQHGQPDPQIMFIAIGDHETDRSPLQVGQFESSDEKLDKWLTSVYLEGGGGSNAGESYLLAHYFAAHHTVTDHWEKRKQKGFLFTIGDEPGLNSIPMATLRSLMEKAVGQTSWSANDLLKLAQEKWHVYHLHITETGDRQTARNYWSQLLGENCVIVKSHKDVANVISEIVTKNSVPVVTPEIKEETKKEEETKITL